MMGSWGSVCRALLCDQLFHYRAVLEIMESGQQNVMQFVDSRHSDHGS